MIFIRSFIWNDTHAYLYDSPGSEKTSYINLTFTHETADALFAYLSEGFPSQKLLSCDIPPVIVLNNTEKNRLLSQVEELNIVNWQDKNALKLRMRSILADIFVRFFYDMPAPHTPSAPQWLTQLLSAMEHPDNFTVGIEQMVLLSGKSREHLSRCLKKYYEITPTEYINDLRINYAANLLLNTNTPILEICFSCGFDSVSYFYKVFRQKYQIAPSSFRRQYKKTTRL